MATEDVPQPTSSTEDAIAAHVAETDPHAGYQKESEKGAASGYASLDATTKVPIAQLPTGTSASTVSLGNHSHADVASLYDANTVLAATADNTPVAVTISEQTLLGRVTGGNVAALTAAQVAGVISAIPKHSELTTGESNLPRTDIVAANALTSGVLYLSYFTAQKTESAGRVRIVCSTGAAATPTLCKVALFSVAAGDDLSSDLTLLAVSANDTSLFSTSNTAYTITFPSWVTKTAGSRYAVGVLVVSGATMPTLAGLPISTLAAVEAAVPPILSAELSGQTDITADVTTALSTSTNLHYVAVLPPVVMPGGVAAVTAATSATLDLVKSISGSLQVTAARSGATTKGIVQSFTAEQTVTASRVSSPARPPVEISGSLRIGVGRYGEVPPLFPSYYTLVIRPDSIGTYPGEEPVVYYGGGGQTTLSDQSDSTYVLVQTAEDPPPTTKYWWPLVTFPATSLPDNAVVDHVEVGIRAKSPDGHAIYVDLAADMADTYTPYYGATDNWELTSGADWATKVWDDLSISWDQVPARDDFNSGIVQGYICPISTIGEMPRIIYVSDIWLRILYHT